MPPESSDAAPTAGSRRRPVWWWRVLGALLDPWLNLRREPAAIDSLGIGDRPVCYVIERYGLSNPLILARACREAGLPSPLIALPGNPLGHKRSYVALSRRRGSRFGRPRNPSHSGSLARLLQSQRENPDQDVLLVPVSIFVGRAPDRQSGWFRVLFSENWALVGRFRRVLAILLNGRNTIVQFSTPVAVSEVVGEGLQPEREVRKVSRVLRAHFRRVRTAVIGPDLSHRRLLVDRVLDAEPVRKAIADQARKEGRKPAEVWRRAHRFAWEIAADYSHPVVRSLSFVLTAFWNRIYNGLNVHHLDGLKEIAPGHEIVYVPCHRSHIDYLVLSYLLYQHNIVPPHIAAGVNLNLPVVGSVLRRGGAFFLRRSFKANALYSSVFSAYVTELISEGFSLEYFIEGGRSRTGRLLVPKAGMLAITVRAFLRRPRRPVVFQPVYIGYERMVEGRSYLDELSGQPKRGESIWALLRGVPSILRQRYGEVSVSFGEPVLLEEALNRLAPAWRDQAGEDESRPEWLPRVVDDLSERILVNINGATQVNPINLVSMCILATPKHAMSEQDLVSLLGLYKRMLTALPISPRVGVSELGPRAMIDYAQRLGLLTRIPHPLGDVLSFQGETAILQSYYRNNVLHLFVAPAWVACCFLNNRRMSRSGVVRLGKLMFPFIRAELFLPWDEAGFVEQLHRAIDLLVAEGLLEFEADSGFLCRGPGQTDAVYQLRAIAHSLQQAFERYYIAIAILVKNGPAALSSSELENLCHLTAQRLSLLYAPAAPEFFDRSLFRGFIQKLKELGIIRADAAGKLTFDDRLAEWAKDSRVILGRELRHTVMKISPEPSPRVDPQPPAVG